MKLPRGVRRDVPRPPQQGAKVPRSKYGSIPTTVDNVVFQSKREAARYVTLKALQLCGAISELRLQPEFPLCVLKAGSAEVVEVGRYIADFAYEQRGALVVEDVKSPATRLKEVYRLKKRIVEATYDFKISEVR